ncbi:uncharacterized protein STEHIDRAFT_169484 [Stereum hirsutum FP-91666 SS1]|uniref:uncharacterized protein n=1 Tax=Stereum hirsutum (strain FP-91666) TaxID=721885 RepID=UPI0004449748|nr:uncharacterized protein STEHIDRAFT_169484 [Stereum hirsutum FP-91666 SS1]EIM85611.1 hypothetical protein STEHIDRAFT_169484 [Stereum hirsutum FP-91666 SS1]
MSMTMPMSNPTRTPLMSRRLGNGDFSRKSNANPNAFYSPMRTKLSVCHELPRERESETESNFVIYSTRSPGTLTPTPDTRASPSPTDKENMLSPGDYFSGSHTRTTVRRGGGGGSPAASEMTFVGIPSPPLAPQADANHLRVLLEQIYAQIPLCPKGAGISSAEWRELFIGDDSCVYCLKPSGLMPDFVAMRFVCNECRCTRLVNPRMFGVMYPQYAENLDAIIPQVPAVQLIRTTTAPPPGVDAESSYYYADDIIRVAKEWLAVPENATQLDMFERAGKAAMRWKQANERMQSAQGHAESWQRFMISLSSVLRSSLFAHGTSSGGGGGIDSLGMLKKFGSLAL